MDAILAQEVETFTEKIRNWHQPEIEAALSEMRTLAWSLGVTSEAGKQQLSFNAHLTTRLRQRGIYA